jgi:hypothetical protein
VPQLILPVITPLLGLIGVSASATVLGTSLTIGALVSNVVAAGAIFGAELLFGQSGRRRPTTPQPQSSVAKEEEAQDVPPCIWGYGRARVGGKLIFREWRSGGIVAYGRVVSCRPIQGVVAHIIDNETLSVSDGPTTLPGEGPVGYYPYEIAYDEPNIVWPNTGSKHGNYTAKYWDNSQGPVPYTTGVGPFGLLEFRNASSAGHVSELLTDYFPELWTADYHRCKGLAGVFALWRTSGLETHMEHYPNFFPRHATVIEQSLVYDPRDEAQSFYLPETETYSIENPTWEYSENPALQIADVFTNPVWFGLGHDDIIWESFAQAADDCDRAVPKRVSGTRPFARSHLAVSATDEPRDIIAKLLTACDGQIYEDENGRVGLRIAKWEEPTVTLDETHISSLKVERGNSVYADVNQLVVRYTEPRLAFAFNTACLVRDEESIARVGVRSQPVDADAIQDDEQAFGILTRVLARKNTPLKVTATGPLRMMIADGERVVRLALPRWGVEGVFRVMKLTRVGASMQGEFHLVTEAMFADVVPPTDALNAELPGVTLIDTSKPATPDAPGLSASTVTGGAEILAVVTFDGDPAPDGDASSFARFRSRAVDVVTDAPLGSGEWTNWPGSLSISLYSANSPLIEGTDGVEQRFEVQAWMVAPRGVPGLISDSAFITIDDF